MSAFSAVARARFKVLLQYRAAALAGVVTQLGFGLIMVAVMRAFYASARPENAPLALPGVVTYLWLGQAFFSLSPWRADPEVKLLVNSGGIAYELLRPLDLYHLWYARAVAMKTAPVALRAPPLITIAYFLGLEPPKSAENAAMWALAFAGAVALTSAFTVLLNISLLWTLSGDGVQLFVPLVTGLLSGQLLPLKFFPAPARAVLDALPFRGLVDTPHRMWIGDLQGGEAWLAIAHQWFWVFLLMMFGRWLLARALSRVVIQGG